MEEVVIFMIKDVISKNIVSVAHFRVAENKTVLFSVALKVVGPVSQKFRYFSDLFRVPRFFLFLHNAEVLSHQTSQSNFLH